MQPHTVQAALRGKVKSVDETTYVQNADGTRGAMDHRLLTNYDERGCSLGGERFDNRGRSVAKFVTTYDKNGDFVQSEGLSPDGQVAWMQTVTFDVVAKTVTSPGGHVPRSSVSYYDAQGRLKEVRNFDADGTTLVNRMTTTYDPSGKQVLVVIYGKGDQKLVTTQRVLNPDGSVALEQIVQANGTVVHILDEYPTHDEHGNWTSRHEKSDATDGSANGTVTERIITYY